MALPQTRIAQAAEVLVGGIQLFEVELLAITPHGLTTFPLAVELAGNAVVRNFTVEVRADRGDWTPAGVVGQTRIHDRSGGLTTVVVDFGQLLTVSEVGVRLGTAFGVRKVVVWDGTRFNGTAYSDNAGTIRAALDSERRTERLQLVLDGTVTEASLATGLLVRLPVLPAGLELSISGGAPVFSHAGDVIAGKDGFEVVGGRTRKAVDLTAALATLTGDPGDAATRTFTLLLRSRIPGLLELHELSRSLGYVYATDLGPNGQRTLEFAAEGFVDVPLHLPADALLVEEVSVVLAIQAKLPQERRLPPVGPARSTRAELLLDASRAAAARLVLPVGVERIRSVRLPLVAGDAGAEVRVLLREHDERTEGPGEAVDAAISDPVVLPAASGDDAFVELSFPAAVEVDATQPPWVVVLVVRGEVVWSVADGAVASAASDLRRGSPEGPWQPLPRIFAENLQITPRARIAALAGRDDLPAPFLIEVCRADQPWSASPAQLGVVPVTNGIAVSWPGALAAAALAPAGGQIVLRVTSTVAGSVTLRDLRAVVTRPA